MTQRVEHVAAQQKLEHNATARQEHDGVVAGHELGVFERVPHHVLEGEELGACRDEHIEEIGKVPAQRVHQGCQQDMAVANLPGAVAAPLLECQQMIGGHGRRVAFDAGHGQPSPTKRHGRRKTRDGAADHHDIVAAHRRGSASPGPATHGCFHC